MSLAKTTVSLVTMLVCLPGQGSHELVQGAPLAKPFVGGLAGSAAGVDPTDPNRLVVFGGGGTLGENGTGGTGVDIVSGGGSTNRFFVGDGTTFEEPFAPVRPFLRRKYAAGATDTLRGLFVVHGGSEAGGMMPPSHNLDWATWTWNGSAWSRHPGPDPGPRVGHGMAFDPLRSRIVLWGGEDDPTPLRDTWEFDGSAWVQIPAAFPNSIPDRRRAFGMAYDPGTSNVILFGGWRLANPLQGNLNDLWRWNGQGWLQVPTTTSFPGPRHGCTLTTDRSPGTPRVLLVGGRVGGVNSAALNDVWAWDGIARSWTSVAVPFGFPPRSDHVAVGTLQGVVVVGGHTQGRSGFGIAFAQDDSWLIDRTGIRPLSEPESRGAHAMAYNHARQETLLFGGNPTGFEQRNPPWQCYDDAWTFDGTVWTRCNAVGPSPRIDSAVVEDSVNGGYILLGGQSPPPGSGGIGVGYVLMGDMWTLRWTGPLQQPVWTNVSTLSQGPSPRLGHAMASDGNGTILLFGGYGPRGIGSLGVPVSGDYNDTWLFDCGTLTWRKVDWSYPFHPGPRSRHGLVHVAGTDRFLMGGRQAGGVGGGNVEDIWEFSGVRAGAGQWTRRDADGVLLPVWPSNLRWRTMAYDPDLDCILAMSGADLWRWDPLSSWRLLSLGYEDRRDLTNPAAVWHDSSRAYVAAGSKSLFHGMQTLVYAHAGDRASEGRVAIPLPSRCGYHGSEIGFRSQAAGEIGPSPPYLGNASYAIEVDLARAWWQVQWLTLLVALRQGQVALPGPCQLGLDPTSILDSHFRVVTGQREAFPLSIPLDPRLLGVDLACQGVIDSAHCTNGDCCGWCGLPLGVTDVLTVHIGRY